MPTTTRGALRYPLLADTPDVPRDIQNLANDVASLMMIYGQGTFASRPTSTVGTPGVSGRSYYGTDTGHYYYDFGTGWTDIGPTATSLTPNSVTSVELADNAVDLAAMQDNSVSAAEIVDGSVGTAEIANALKPSAGAGAATESLRALGTAAGTAAAGTHAAQHSRTGADPLVIGTFVSSGLASARPSTGLVAGMIYTKTDISGGTTEMYNGSIWVAMAASVSGGGVATHASTHLSGGTDAIAWSTAHGAGLASARPAAGVSNAGYLWFSTDTGVLQRSDGAATWTTVSTVNNVTYATTPPGSPANGDIWIWVDSTTNPTFQWMMRYNSASSSAYKWENIGGPDAYATVVGGSAPPTTAYGTSSGLTYAVPRAGDYILEYGFYCGSGNDNDCWMAPDGAGLAANDADAAASGQPGGGTSGVRNTPTYCRKFFGLTAATITWMLKRSSATGAACDRPWVRVRPSRVS